MNNTDRGMILAIFYIALFLILAPALFGGIVALIYWAPSDVWLPLWIVYTSGLVATAIFISPLIPKMYIINDGYTVSFHLDPFFGSGANLLSGEVDETRQLIARGPKFNLLGWWEKFDSTTEHEKEFRIPLKGKFETSGDNLNLELEGGLLILKAPIESARILRSIAKGMHDIREEIQAQLGPALNQAVAFVFIKYDSDFIVRNQSLISNQVQAEFERFNQIRTNYGLVTVKFVLGDINFSTKINDAREAARAAELRANATAKIKEKNPNASDKEVLEFVLASEKLATININRNVNEIIGLSPEVITAAGEFALAAKALKNP